MENLWSLPLAKFQFLTEILLSKENISQTFIYDSYLTV